MSVSVSESSGGGSAVAVAIVDDGDVNSSKYLHLFNYINGLRMRDVRLLFSHMRKLDREDPDVFFPKYGFTAGEFSVSYVIHMPCRSKADGSAEDQEEEDAAHAPAPAPRT